MWGGCGMYISFSTICIAPGDRSLQMAYGLSCAVASKGTTVSVHPVYLYSVPGGGAECSNLQQLSSTTISCLQRDLSQFLFQPLHPLVYPGQLGHKGLDSLHLQLLGPAAVFIEAPRHLAQCSAYCLWKRRWERMWMR